MTLLKLIVPSFLLLASPSQSFTPAILSDHKADQQSVLKALPNMSISSEVSKVSIYIATSLDGFIAREDGRLDWLPGSSSECDEENADDNGFFDFMASVDVVIMGRKTFDFVAASEQWPYTKPVVVLSKNKDFGPPKHLQSKEITVCSKSPYELVDAYPGQHLYVDGGQTIRSFLQAGVVTDMTIFRVPVLIGTGVPLFTGLSSDICLNHIETKVLPAGMVQSTYHVI